MENIFIEATDDTPAVRFVSTGRLTIEGRSLPENTSAFYGPLLKWVSLLDVESVVMDINLDYINSSSSNQILRILKILDSNDNIKKLIINWYYDNDDDDTLELGKVYEELLKKASFRYRAGQ